MLLEDQGTLIRCSEVYLYQRRRVPGVEKVAGTPRRKSLAEWNNGFM